MNGRHRGRPDAERRFAWASLGMAGGAVLAAVTLIVRKPLLLDVGMWAVGLAVVWAASRHAARVRR